MCTPAENCPIFFQFHCKSLPVSFFFLFLSLSLNNPKGHENDAITAFPSPKTKRKSCYENNNIDLVLISKLLTSLPSPIGSDSF